MPSPVYLEISSQESSTQGTVKKLPMQERLAFKHLCKLEKKRAVELVEGVATTITRTVSALLLKTSWIAVELDKAVPDCNMQGEERVSILIHYTPGFDRQGERKPKRRIRCQGSIYKVEAK